MNLSQNISLTNTKRLIKDIKDVITNNKDFKSSGIYYKHDENNLLIGYALIIGPENTIYENGYYFFSFNFPTDYPFSPPKLTFFTKENSIRFNPNLYTNGKVCISILNTWKGEQWTSCQTIRSVLFSLLSIFTTKNPLTNEPGISENHADNNNYNKIIQFQNYNISIRKQIENIENFTIISLFKEEIKNHFINNKSSILNKIKSLSDDNEHNNKFLRTSLYGLSSKLDYLSLYTIIDKLSFNS